MCFLVTCKVRQRMIFIQVNLFQKHVSMYLFLHQLHNPHNMTKDCSLNYESSAWKLQAHKMLCTHKLFWINVKTKNSLCTQHVLNLNFSCSELVIQSVVILWVSWCKNKCFSQRFTCRKINILLVLLVKDFFLFISATFSRESQMSFYLR